MKKPALYIAAVIAACTLIAGCSSTEPPAPVSPSLAEVNGEPITVDQLNHRMKFLNLGFNNFTAGGHAGDAKIEALSQLIEEAMYLQEAERLGIGVSPEDVEAHVKRLSSEYPGGALDDALAKSGLTMEDLRAEATTKLLIEKLIDSQVYSGLAHDEKLLRDYFDGHREELHRPAQVRARQIVVDSKEAARSILDELKAGADFSAVARERSLSPDGEAGGDLGYFARGDMPPEFEEVVFRMKPGELSGVVHTPYGFHIFKVDDVRQAQDPGFEDVKELVKQRFMASAGEEAYLGWQAGLRERTSIEVHTEMLGRL